MKNTLAIWNSLIAISIVLSSVGYVHSTQSMTPSEPRLVESFILLPQQNVILNSTPYKQTTDYTCGPAAVMTLLHYFGKLSLSDMNHVTEIRIATEMGTMSDTGTSPEQIVIWLQNHGFYAELKHQVTGFIIEENIDRGIPILVVIGHHWVLATGYITNSNNNDKIYFSDSDIKIRVMSTGQVDSLWVERICRLRDCNSTVGDYIVAIPIK